MIDETMKTLPSETLAVFNNDRLRARIFYEKYALRNLKNISVETQPRQMWERLARELARVETSDVRDEWEKNFLWLLADFKFVPGGRILHAIGNLNKVPRSTATSSQVRTIPFPAFIKPLWSWRRHSSAAVDAEWISPAFAQRTPQHETPREFLPGPSRSWSSIRSLPESSDSRDDEGRS